MKRKNKIQDENNYKKQPTVFNVFLFILIVTFVGFGGGNALMPIIKKYSVDKYEWLTISEFDDLVITVNLIPGPSVIQALSYVSIKLLGKFKGTMVCLIANLPSIFFALGIFISLGSINRNWLLVISTAVIPLIIGVVLAFSYQYYKTSRKELSFPIWFLIFIFTFAFSFFIPSPYNISALVLVFILLSVFIFEFFRQKRKSKTKKNISNFSKEEEIK
ncbi:chromate transporter [[Mycoplasma] mobile]|uniref:Chromate transport protein n=1 Tax=Mycoplasma mobile (strain ATCC 43663 / 163K / NCTC 11711) TaxID=267748 RepID=Q6KHI6_MYCM1|nr:chromate transporter [[Mycoplasma] mobile]AAT27944.1 chromate transport protein [Mycoplasma mobile 163K]